MWNAFIPEVTLHTHTYAVSHNITADNNPISVLKMYIVWWQWLYAHLGFRNGLSDKNSLVHI